MNLFLKNVAIAASLMSTLHAMQIPESKLNHFPKDITSEILKRASTDQILEFGSEVSFDSIYGDLRLVCKNWQTIIDNWIDPDKKGNTWMQLKKEFWIESLVSAYTTRGDGEECRLFLNIKLLYTPKKRKLPKIFSIANLKKPFSGQFDLSSLGYINDYISISTGCRKEVIAKNNYFKAEIWITPWFLLKDNINDAANHLKPIFLEWQESASPIGIFWNYGRYEIELYDYLVDEDLNTFFTTNLYKLWEKSDHANNYIRNSAVRNNATSSLHYMSCRAFTMRPDDSEKFQIIC